jgi:hypothetical protein
MRLLVAFAQNHISAKADGVVAVRPKRHRYVPIRWCLQPRNGNDGNNATQKRSSVIFQTDSKCVDQFGALLDKPFLRAKTSATHIDRAALRIGA